MSAAHVQRVWKMTADLSPLNIESMLAAWREIFACGRRDATRACSQEQRSRHEGAHSQAKAGAITFSWHGTQSKGIIKKEISNFANKSEELIARPTDQDGWGRQYEVARQSTPQVQPEEQRNAHLQRDAETHARDRNCGDHHWLCLTQRIAERRQCAQNRDHRIYIRYSQKIYKLC